MKSAEVLLTNTNVSQTKAQPVARTPGKLRVLHLITSLETGGTERQAVELLKRLDRDRYDLRLAVIRKEGQLLSELAPLFPELPEFRLGSFYNANALRKLRQFRALLVNERIEILHTHDFYAGLFGALAAQFSGVRVIASQRHLRLSERAAHDWGRRLGNRLADRLVVNAEMIREHIIATRAADPRKIVVIRNGLAENLVDKSQPEAAAIRRELLAELQLSEPVKLVGLIANLRPVKGHRYLLEAAVQIIQRHPQTHFVLLGEGPLREEIAAQAVSSGLAARVHLLGQRDGAARYNAAFDVAVLASLHEGLPNTVMEAMAAGATVVSTAVGGACELVTDAETGFLVPPADAPALAEAISAALADDDLRARTGERARRFVHEQFSMRRMVESVEQLYEELRR
jgi:glycosyltransferase involved in cell wall biosynthesis